MKKTRQLPGPGPSFFAFQAVIMGLIGVMILISLFFAAFGNNTSIGEVEDLASLRDRFDKVSRDKTQAEHLNNQKKALEKERESLKQLLVMGDPKASEQAYQQRLAEIDAATQLKGKIQEQITQVQAQYSQQQQEKGSVRLAYRPSIGGHAPIIAVLDSGSAEVITAPGGEWGKLTGALFQEKLSLANHEKVHVVLYARPSSIKLLEELRDFLKKHDFTFGYQAVGENERLSFLQQ